jgi:hypothetical protein
MRIGHELRWFIAGYGLVLGGGCHKAHHPTHVADGGTLDAGIELGACVTVTPRDVDFGNVLVNTTATQSVALTNNCDAGVEVTIGALRGTDPLWFSTNPASGTVIALNEHETIALIAQYHPLVASPSQSRAYFPISDCHPEVGCYQLVSLRGNPVDTGLCVNPFTVDFGFGSASRSVTKSVALCNCGNSTIHLTADPAVLNHTSSGTTPAGPFQPGPAFPTNKIDILVGQCIQAPVVFTPQVAGFFTGELDISTDDPQSSDLTIPLLGFGGGAAISCSPLTVSFGENAVGISSTLSVSCTNVGTNVPGHPEASLFLPNPASTDQALTIQNGAPAFQAAFDQPFPPGGLTAGESAQIDVTYTPRVAGTDSDTLMISSNDSVNPRVSVALNGAARALPSCHFQLSHSGGIAFGHVDNGISATLPFVIRNIGANDCLVDALQIANGSSPVFSLPDYPSGSSPPSVDIFPGGSLEVAVQFAPTTAQAHFAGAVSFTISDPTNPHQTVNLTGSSLAGCLQILPASLNFGLVGFDPTSSQWCKSGKRTVTILNSCPNTDVTVGSLSVIDLAQNHGTPQPEFILTRDPSPVTIPRACLGQSCLPVPPVSFQLGFEPYQEGKHAGAVEIFTSDLADPYLVALSGDAETSQQHTDDFTAHGEAVDVLWVMDTDDDTQAQQAIIDDLPSFLTYPLQNGIDFQMAVTSTDVYASTTSEDGSIEPCPHCKLPGTTPEVVKSSDGQDAAGKLARLLNLGEGAFCYVNCNGFFSDEQFFEATYEALSELGPGGYNQPLYRPDAFLAVILVNGDAEDDLSETHGLNFYYNVFIGLKGARNANKFSFSYVSYYGYVAHNLKTEQMVQLTGGVEADLINTGSPSWRDQLAALWPQLEVQMFSYALSATPVPGTIQVADNGVVVPATQGGITNWTYDAGSNAVQFNRSVLPAAGDAVQISYTVACAN